nr:DUF2345 domain-containing protein [Paraburkholderia sp. BCC1885]
MSSNESLQGGTTETVVLENQSIYESLCSKINLKPVSVARPLEAFRDNDLLSESSADERLARGMSAFLKLVGEASKRITMAAGDALSFFASKLGIRIFSAKGKVQIQAQGDALELMALENVVVSSSTGEVMITAAKGITLGDGSGAYIKIANGRIELASPSGPIDMKGNLEVDGPAGGSFTFPNWTSTPLKDVKDNLGFSFSE